MAEILTYDSLIDVLPQYVNRKDSFVLANLPLFISLGQRRIADDTQMLGLKTLIEGTLLIDEPYIPKPNAWLITSYFQIGYDELNQTGFNTTKNLFNRQETFCLQYWPDLTQTDLPQYYADIALDQILIVPVPDRPYPYKWSYYQIPVLIDAVTQQNYLTQYKPNLLIYACLVEIYGYLKDTDQCNKWKTEYQQALQSTGQQNMARLSDEQDRRT